MSRTVTSLSLLALAAMGLVVGLKIVAASPAAEIQSAGSRPDGSRPAAARIVPASFRFTKPAADRPEEEPAAPISLTASDGTGLSLVALEADGVLEPPLAFTELHLTFENPRNEIIEGRFASPCRRARPSAASP